MCHLKRFSPAGRCCISRRSTAQGMPTRAAASRPSRPRRPRVIPQVVPGASLAKQRSHGDLPDFIVGGAALAARQLFQALPLAGEVVQTFAAWTIAGMRDAKAL